MNSPATVLFHVPSTVILVQISIETTVVSSLASDEGIILRYTAGYVPFK